MKERSLHPDPTFLPASLAASSVGTWDYDVVHDRLRYCRSFAALYDLPPEQGGEGVLMGQVVQATHPDDRALGQAKRAHLFRHGGAFVFEHRILSPLNVVRWSLVRGFYEADEAGRVTRGRGIALDVTEGKQEGYAEGDVFFVTEADERKVTALDRAARHVLAARKALAELGTEGNGLSVSADTLLLEIAQHVVSVMIPVKPGQTGH